MEFYDKLVARFDPGAFQSKESCFQQGQSLIITKSFLKSFGEYDDVTLTML